MATDYDPLDRAQTAVNGGELPSERLSSLADAAMELNATLSVSEVVERVTEQARNIVGAQQAVTSFTVDHNWAQAVTAVSPSDRSAAWSDGSVQPDDAGLYRLVCERNQPIRLTQVQIEAHPAWRLADDGERPVRGWLAAPLVSTDGSNVGLVQLSDKDPQRDGGEFTADDEATLVQLAQLASIAMVNASVYERERTRARSLQRQLLPEELPKMDGLAFAARYIAGGHGAEVGGDWYDVVPLDDTRVALVVGDVMGRGIPAASVMGQLRIGVRAFALEDLPPGDVLSSLDRLVETLDGDYFVTLLYAVWDLERDTITFANAGHLPPLLRMPHRTSVFLRGNQDSPIGVHGDPYRTHHVDAPPGSTLLLHSDGLVEHRNLMLERTLGTLARVTASGPAHPEALADEVLDALPPSEDDDVTLLVTHRPSTEPAEDAMWMAAPPPDEELRLPASPEAAERARRWITASVSQRGRDDLAELAQLLTSELVTNAILHAETELTLTLTRPDGGFRVAVSDEDFQLPSVGALDPEASGGRGMQLVGELASDWGVYVRPAGKTVWFELTDDAAVLT